MDGSLVRSEGNGDDDESARLPQHLPQGTCVPDWREWMHDLFISRSRWSCRETLRALTVC